VLVEPSATLTSPSPTVLLYSRVVYITYIRVYQSPEWLRTLCTLCPVSAAWRVLMHDTVFIDTSRPRESLFEWIFNRNRTWFSFDFHLTRPQRTSHSDVTWINLKHFFLETLAIDLAFFWKRFFLAMFDKTKNQNPFVYNFRSFMSLREKFS
jgi:hypothetical protein